MMLRWRVHVGAVTGDGEMHDPPMQLVRSAER